MDRRRFGTQFVALVAGRGTATVLSAGWFVVAARNLSNRAFGQLALLLALGTMVGILADLGLQTAMAREVARLGVLDPRLLLSVVRRRLALGVLASIVLILLYHTSSGGGSLWPPVIFSASILGTAVYGSEIAGLTALGHAHVDAANEVVSRAGVLLVGSLWLLNGGGLLAAVAVYALADICSAATISLVAQRHLRRAAAEPDLADIRIRRSIGLALALVAAILYARVDTWLLGQLDGPVLAGHYAAADRVLDAVLLAPAALGSLSISVTGGLRRSERWRATRPLLALSAGLAAVSGAVVAVFSHQVLVGVFGPSFGSVRTTLILLLASALPGAVAATAAPVAAISTGWRFTWAMGVGLALNVGLNLGLIPTYGTNGAAIANLVSEALLAVALAVLIWRARDTTPISAGQPGVEPIREVP